MCVSSSLLKYFFCQVTEWLGRKYTWDRYWYCADDVDDCLCHFYLYRKSNRIHVLMAPPAGAYPPFTIASYWKSFKQHNSENSSCSQRFILLHREQFNLIVSSCYSFTWLDKPEQHLTYHLREFIEVRGKTIISFRYLPKVISLSSFLWSFIKLNTLTCCVCG